MDIHARHIAVNGRHKQLLPPTSLLVAEGQLVLVRCLGDEATTLALALSGRIEPDDGAVLVDGTGNEAALREHVAIVDAPRVTEPEGSRTLSAIVAESLGLAGHPSGKATVQDWLLEQRAEQYAKYRFDTLPAPLRTRLLVELAVVDEQVRVLILDTPDRHTGDAQTWWSVALRQAQRGLGVVVLCADGTARGLHPESAKVGQMQQPPPIEVGPEGLRTAQVAPTDPSFGTQYGDVRSDDEQPAEADEEGYISGEHSYEEFWGEYTGEQTAVSRTGQLPPEADEERTELHPIVLEDEPRLGEHQYSEHQYSDADFSQDTAEPRGSTRWDSLSGIGARLAGAEPGSETDSGSQTDPDSAAETDSSGESTPPSAADPEETTTLHRVTEREDS